MLEGENEEEQKKAAEHARLKGNDFYKRRKYHDAINSYCDSINTHPTSSALSNLAIALSGAGPTQNRLNVIRCLLLSVSLEPERVKAVEKLNTELTLSGDIEAASRMASGEMMIKMDGFTPKRVRECFQNFSFKKVSECSEKISHSK